MGRATPESFVQDPRELDDWEKFHEWTGEFAVLPNGELQYLLGHFDGLPQDDPRHLM